MSLDALVAEAGRALGDARRLFGPMPLDVAWGSSTGQLGAGRDAVGAAGSAAQQDWAGAGASTYVAAAGGRVRVLGSVMGADDQTTPGVSGAARASAQGRGGMDAVIDSTRSGVAAIAPSTDTPAGRAALVAHLQAQLDRAKALLRVSEQRNVALATLIRGGAMGYRGGGMGAPMGAGLPTPTGGGFGMPTFGGAGGGSLPGLSGLRQLGGLLAPATPHATFSPTRADGTPLGQLTLNSSPHEVAAAIIHEAQRRGYTPGQTKAILADAMDESDLSPRAIGGGGLWHSIFQQDASYEGRDNPNANIAEFFNRLEHHGGPSSPDIWKSIFWLQQAPAAPNADSAYQSGRQAYLSEIRSHFEAASALYDEIAGMAAAAAVVDIPGS